MDIGFELLTIGIAMLTTIYAALWYLVILGTGNKNTIQNLTEDIKNLTDRLDKCRYCTKMTE